MKKRIWLSILILLGFVIAANKCEKDKDSSTVIDTDGNVYTTVIIGTQVWMVENLRTTIYNDNTAIPIATDNTEWSKLTTPAFCWYKNDATTYKTTYGGLYNWYTVNTGKLCPKGWHVPADAEWTTLINYLGGEIIAGGKLKEAGTTHWISPNTNATNEIGFTALPGSFRNGSNGNFGIIGSLGFWWSSTEYSSFSREAWYLGMSSESGSLIRGIPLKEHGNSVRCVKDQYASGK